MKKIASILLLALCAHLYTSCDLIESGAEPDLTWNAYDNVFNPCTGFTEYLDTRNLFFVNNLGFPFNGYPQSVLLYYREFQGGFFDCQGLPWYIVPPTTIISYRSMTNLSTSGKTTKPAKSPQAQAYTKVVRPDGSAEKYDGPIITFNDIPAGSTQTVETPITITSEGTYFNSYEADPKQLVSESDESNNQQSDNFSRSSSGGLDEARPSFIIKVPGETELSAIKTRYAIFRNGQIMVKNQ
jgi:hypothetical protein